MTVPQTKFATVSIAFVLKSVKLSPVHREQVAKALSTKLYANAHLDNEAILSSAVSKMFPSRQSARLVRNVAVIPSAPANRHASTTDALILAARSLAVPANSVALWTVLHCAQSFVSAHRTASWTRTAAVFLQLRANLLVLLPVARLTKLAHLTKPAVTVSVKALAIALQTRFVALSTANLSVPVAKD
jgi:hypothetical protein